MLCYKGFVVVVVVAVPVAVARFTLPFSPFYIYRRGTIRCYLFYFIRPSQTRMRDDESW